VLVRPEAVALGRGDGVPGEGGVVEVIEYYGHDSLYIVRTDAGAAIRSRAAAAPELRRGDRVALRYAGGPTVAFATTPA
jgi:iron(III) transport system ATP-binding protein